MKKYLLFLLCFFSVLGPVFSQGNQVRKPVVAGSFYPAGTNELSANIQKYLNNAKGVTENDEIFGLISPHAGYVFSGIVAAQGYKQIIGRDYDCVIVISPSHHEYFNFSSVMESGSYQTPLGTITIDKKMAKKIATGKKSIKLSTSGHFQSHLARQEHSLEVQLPLLQKTLGDFNFVPIVMGDQSLKACNELSDAIYKAAKDKKILIIASSDLSHFHPYQEAKKIDENCVAIIENYDSQKLLQQLESGKVEACGGAPIVTMLKATKRMGADKIKILMYANSGDTYGDRSSVVGYMSAVAVRKKPDQIDGEIKSYYSKAEKDELLHIARVTIENSVKGLPVPEFKVKYEKLVEKRGAFVTLNKFGQLRGCIGFTQPAYPLYQTVGYVARSAALEDPRFPPVNVRELKQLHLEISVLTLPGKITDINKIQVGKHGIIIKQGLKQGLLLPQVAVDYNWDRITFLEQSCLKAGLKKNDWKNPSTEIFIFSADIFGEN